MTFENLLFMIWPLWKWVLTTLQNDILLSWDSAQGTQGHSGPYYTCLPELVSTLRGLLDVVRALVPLGVFWAALAAAARAAKFCNCIAFNPATSKARDQPTGTGASYPLQQWPCTLAEGWSQRGTVPDTGNTTELQKDSGLAQLIQKLNISSDNRCLIQ